MDTKKLILILLFLLAAALFSQEKDAVRQNKGNYAAGLEADLLPYITGGYYGSAWYGYDKVRIRGIAAQVRPPAFIIKDGFEKLKTTSYTVIADYFPFSKPGAFEGFWAGFGYEFWKNEIANKSDKTNKGYENSVITIGGGYIFCLYKNIYINPWVAGHFSVSGTSSFPVGNASYSPSVFLPEASVKIGIRF